MSNKYVKVDDVMNLINTTNRGNCDYLIVDKIEELCNSNNIYDIDKVVNGLDGYITQIVGRNSQLYKTVIGIVNKGMKNE